MTVYEVQTLRRKKVLSTTEVTSTEFKCLAFSSDSKFLIAQGGSPDWTLTYWSWDKSKLVASAKTSNPQGAPIYQCTFNPLDSSHVCVSGNGILKYYRFLENTLKGSSATIGKRDPQNYLCHAWLDEERVIVATDTGDLLMFDFGELKLVLPMSPSDGNSIDCIIAYSKGFVCGGDLGVLSIFEKTDDKEFYRRARTCKIDSNPEKITSLAITSSEDVLACVLDNAQMYSLALSSTDMYKSEDIKLELLAQPFHSKGITGVDTCIRKPLVVTCSLDRTVRVWNYLDRTIDLNKTFQEEAFSVAFHPSGLHILVGFSDKLRLMNLLMGDIRPYREFSIKACRECCFSNGGQYFAAVNSNAISIYNTYTCELIWTLRGHNGKVRSVHWSADDSRIISAGADGAVYEWGMSDQKRKGETVHKGTVYNSCLTVPDGRSIVVVGSDKTIKEISDSTVQKEFPTLVELTNVVMSSGKIIFAGTDEGTVRAYKYPLTSAEFQEFQCHSKPVSRIVLSFDEIFLFTVSEDGSLCIWDVRDKERAKQQKEIQFADEILVTKADLEEKAALTAELENKVTDLTEHIDYQLRLKDMTYTERIKDLTDKYTAEFEAERSKYDVLAKERNEIEIEFDERYNAQANKHKELISTMEANFSAKLMAEMERYTALQKQMEEMNSKWDEQTMLLVEGHEKVIQEINEDYDNRITEDLVAIERLNEEKEEAAKTFDETRRQIEEDADREIEELKEKYEAKLAVEREAGLRLKGENGIMRNKFLTLGNYIEDHKQEIKAQFEEIQSLNHQLQNRDKDIAGLKKEISERDQTIGDKEKRIYDLKKKNQELEKFKFVLDYKIKELKRLIDPLTNEITDMKNQIKEMDAELEMYFKVNANLELTITDLKLKIEGLNKDANIQRQRYADAEGTIKRIKTDIHEMMNHIQDAKVLKERAKALYTKHVTQAVQNAAVDVDIQAEYSRQREYLERNLDSIKRKLSKDSTLHKAENRRIIEENVSLIKEINELRRELKGTKALASSDKAGPRGGRAGNARGAGGGNLERELEYQREEIARLRERLALYENDRPKSRERLPPMAGFQEHKTPTPTPSNPTPQPPINLE